MKRKMNTMGTTAGGAHTSTAHHGHANTTAKRKPARKIHGHIKHRADAHKRGTHGGRI